MAVFTPVTHEELEQWLAPLHLGTLVAHKGIASGIENSNFFVTLARDGVHTDYVLTIFEVLKAEQLPFYLELMQHLAQKGLPGFSTRKRALSLRSKSSMMMRPLRKLKKPAMQKQAIFCLSLQINHWLLRRRLASCAWKWAVAAA